MLYATDRMPAEPGADPLDRFYTSEHGPVPRLGSARIRLREDELDWEEVSGSRLPRTGKRAIRCR